MKYRRVFKTRLKRAAAGILLTVAVSGWLWSPSSRAESGIDVQTTIDTDSITVGERLHIRYTIGHPDSLELLPVTGLKMGSCRLLSIQWKEKREEERRLDVAEIEVFTLDLEEAYFPGAELRFRTPSGDTLTAFADDVVVPVRALASSGGDLNPLKNPWEAPADYMVFILTALIAVLAAAALFLWWRRRKRRVVPEIPKPELPPDVVALSELARIENMELLRDGEFKKFYTLVTDAIRMYLEGRFDIDAMDRTTGEILTDLDRVRMRVERLEDLLREADLVKFAKFIPGIESGSEALKTARDIVIQTRQPRISEIMPLSVEAKAGAEQ